MPPKVVLKWFRINLVFQENITKNRHSNFSLLANSYLSVESVYILLLYFLNLGWMQREKKKIGKLGPSDTSYGDWGYLWPYPCICTWRLPHLIKGICPPSVMVKVLDGGIIVSLNSSRAIMFTFRQIPLGKVWNPLSSQLWVK